MPSKRKVALGIALGGLAGLVVRPVALVAGGNAGGGAGEKSAKNIEVDFSSDKLQTLNYWLVLGGSALVLICEHRWFNSLQVERCADGG